MKISLNKIVLLVAATFPLVGCEQLQNSQAFDINAMARNLSANLPQLDKFVFGIAFMVGVWFIYSAVMKLRIYGESRVMMPVNANFSGPLLKFITGIVLIALPSFVDISTYTIWGSTSLLTYDYAGLLPVGWKDLEMGLLGIIQLFGYIAFVRGLIMLKNTAGQNAPQGIMGKSLIHLIGGIFCINIVGTIYVLEATFGL
jgi:intracellular multiplication protein IcmC